MQKILKVAVLTVSLMSLLALSSYSVFADEFTVSVNFNRFTAQLNNSYVYNPDNKRLRMTDINSHSTGGSSNLTVYADTNVSNVNWVGYSSGCTVVLKAPSDLNNKVSANNRFSVEVSVNSYYNATSDIDLSNYHLMIRDSSNYSIEFDCVAYEPLGTGSYSTFNYILKFNSTVAPVRDFNLANSTWTFSFFEPKGRHGTTGNGDYYYAYQYVFATCFLTSNLSDIQQGVEDIQNSIEEQTDQIVNADYGYETPSEKGNVDNGVSSLSDNINALSNQINQSVTDFQGSVSGIADAIDGSSGVVWGWLDHVPSWFIAIIVAFGGILAARKVLK